MTKFEADRCQTSNRISRSLPFKTQDISLGLNYLGYFIKPSGYFVKDWLWLIKKFENRIQHWSFKLLSLGGRLVPIRVVLASLSVYWLSLVPLPKSIFRKLKSLIFDFLWGSTGNKKKLHLADWTSLSKPTSQGGWGIKNLECFNTSLRLKSFWLALWGNGLWLKLISVKYLKKNNVLSWIWFKAFSARGVSVIWKGFISTISWFGSGLTWMVGNGESTRVGLDPIIGMGTSFTLP